MKSVLKSVLLAGLLATAGFAAFSQAPAAGDCGPMHEGMRHPRMGHLDPGKMQSWLDKRHADLKAQLKLTPAQEGAWTTYAAAMKPPADLIAKRPDLAELDKLPTPERLDKMKALRTQHMADMTAAMDQRGAATKVFYATLTPEQQKVFDASATRQHGSQGRHGGPRDGKAPMSPKPPASTK